MKTPRNAPCPCGSGKKYKRCCGATAQSDKAPSSPSKPLGKSILDLAQQRKASVQEDFQAYIAEAAAKQSEQAIDELLGLNPAQAEDMINHPFSSPEVLSFDEEWVSNSNFMRLFDDLAAFVESGNASATARGLLPLTWCREVHQNYRDGLNETLGTIRSEQDFDQLNAVRNVAETAGLIANEDGRFTLTQKYHELNTKEERSQLCFILFSTYAKKYYWACRDTFKEIHIVQSSFAYTLYMLSIFGEQQRPVKFYEDLFLKGFLKGIKLDDEEWGRDCEEEVRNMYCCRAIERFAYFWGLIEMTRDESQQGARAWLVKKTAQLDSLVQFKC